MTNQVRKGWIDPLFVLLAQRLHILAENVVTLFNLKKHYPLVFFHNPGSCLHPILIRV